MAEFDGGRSPAEAEAYAFEACILEWLNQHPEPTDRSRCAYCGETEKSGAVVVPFETASHGHTWLHHSCWHEWYAKRRDMAIQALSAFGIVRPTQRTHRQLAKGHTLEDDR